MCQYQLDVCPYPHQDPIASTVLDFNKYKSWKLCDEPRPWGRLSCGNISIHHRLPKLSRRQTSSDMDENTVLSSQAQQPLDPKVVPHLFLPDNDVPVVVGSPTECASDSGFSTPGDATSLVSINIFTAATTPDITQYHDFSAMFGGTKCEWCTIMLKAVSYKSIVVQNEAKDKMKAMENVWDHNSTLRALHDDIAKREGELNRVRQKAWLLANKMTNRLGSK